ncbi:MAG: phosphomannomutase/phosphoglucomutase [Candidatus Diapherotrites archaeon]|nr:phosphomannomutase/phosphoglucomutase [Candidatus Diapherotrites archaeon]
MFPEHVFREYDIRGIAEQELTNEFCYSLARAFCSYLKLKGKRVVVGRDNRISGKRISKYFLRGLLDSGCDVININITPTPVLYYSIFKFNADAGVEISASHNPKEFNGFKLCREEAKPVYGEEIQQIKQIMKEKKYESSNKKGRIFNKDANKIYITDLSKRFELKRKISLVLDCGNGTTSFVAPKLLKKIGCKLKCLYCKSDGNFPNHIPDPTVPEAMNDLIKEVKNSNYALGIGLDGDGDRIGAVDNKGNLIYGETLLLVFARDLLKRKKSSIVIYDTKCSKAVHDVIVELGGVPIEWKSGHSLIKAKMRELNSPLAGEMSGHIYLNENYYPFDDAIFASCKLVEILSKEKRDFSDILLDFPKYYSSPEIRVDCPDDKKFIVINSIKKDVGKKYKVSEIDGVKFFNEKGWVLFRASNTQPKIIIRFEAYSKENYYKLYNEVLGILKKYPEVKTGKDFNLLEQ